MSYTLKTAEMIDALFNAGTDLTEIAISIGKAKEPSAEVLQTEVDEWKTRAAEALDKLAEYIAQRRELEK